MELTLALRAPKWCAAPRAEVNGGPAGAEAGADGYIRLRRTWKRGDVVRITLPMPPVRLRADPRVRADFGRIAVQRGPLVYCLEEADNGQYLSEIVLPPEAALRTVTRPDLLGGVTVVTATGKAPAVEGDVGVLYAADRAEPALIDRPLTFIPYYAWANRTAGEMLVWVRER